MINPEALIRPKMFPAKRYQRNLLKVKVYEHNEEQKPSGQRVRTHSSILKSFEMESRLKGKKVRIQDQKDEKSDDEFSLLKKFNKPISPIPTKMYVLLVHNNFNNLFCQRKCTHRTKVRAK